MREFEDDDDQQEREDADSEVDESEGEDEPGSENRDGLSIAAPVAPLEDEPENPWDLFIKKWENHGSAAQSQDELPESQIIKYAPFVNTAISTPQRMNSQTEEQILAGNINKSATPSLEENGVKQDSSASSPRSSTERGVRPSSASSQEKRRPGRPWFTGISGSVPLMAERFGGDKKKPTREKDRDPIPSDKEDSKDQSFLLKNPAPRKSDFLESGNAPDQIDNDVATVYESDIEQPLMKKFGPNALRELEGRASVPGDEGVGFSLGNWEDGDGSPGPSKRKPLWPDFSTSDRKSTRLRRQRKFSERPGEGVIR
ncbi:hypothetical protein ACHAPE_007562 [Trichoderma viride]